MEASICASFDRLRPNEKLKPYYGEQPHKVIINPILSLDTPFSSWIGDLEVKWHTRSEAYYPCDHVQAASGYIQAVLVGGFGKTQIRVDAYFVLKKTETDWAPEQARPAGSEGPGRPA